MKHEIIMAIDPGNTESAYIVWDGEKIIDKGKLPNEGMRGAVRMYRHFPVYIEMIASYGMPVGASVFETCVWIGRFQELCLGNAILIYRKDVKMHHCNSMRAKDSNIRAALIDKYGKSGTKKQPGLTYGLHSDLWSAFAICTYITETQYK